MRSLKQALQEHELIILRVIGEWWDIDLTGLNKENSVKTLANSLPQLDIPQELIYLPPLEAEAIRALVAKNGRLQAASFGRQFGRIREMGPGALEREEPWYEPQSATEDLWYRGLIYKTMDKTDDGMVEFFYLPDEYLAQFEPADFKPEEDGPIQPHKVEEEVEAPKRPPPPPVISGKPAFGKTIDLAKLGVSIPDEPAQAQTPPPMPASTVTPSPPPQKPAVAIASQPPPPTTPSKLQAKNKPDEHQPAQTNAVDDVTTLLSLAQAEQLRVGHAELLPPYMQNGSLHRLELLTTLAVEMNFLREVGDGLYRPTRAAVGWLQQDRESQLRALAEAWATSAWNELRHMSTLQCEGSGWQNDPISARTALIDTLKIDSSWYSTSNLNSVVKQNNPDFQRPNGNYDAWYIRDTISGHYLNGYESWDLVEGRLLEYIIKTPMYWLGLADKSEELFRLTPRAIAWLGETAVPTSQAVQSPPIVVNADSSLQISQHVERYKRFQASRIATMMPLPQTAVQDEIIYQYRLTPQALNQARENKITPERVITFLTEASGQPLPASTRRAIIRWGEKGTEGRVEAVLVLRVGSADILETLRQQAKTRPYLGESLGDLSVVVLEKNWEPLCSAAAQLGLLLEPPKA